MSDLFEQPAPIRIVLHVNLWPGRLRFDWDGMAQNPDTGDILSMFAQVAAPRESLGPELSRMLLWCHEVVREQDDASRRR